MKYSGKSYFGLGRVPVGIGAVLKGWDITEEEFRDPKRLPVVDFRLMTEACPLDCLHCFTDKQKRTLTLKQIKWIIDQLVPYRPKGIDLEGEGEPTIDPYFFNVVEHITSKGIQPIIFTEAATKLRDRDFVRRLNKIGATISPKMDSFYNPDYENWVTGDKTGEYFEKRNEAIQILIEEGFNEIRPDGTTRMGFDMVVSTPNLHEVPDILRFCRKNNLWIVFSLFLPVGRVLKNGFDKSLYLTENDKKWLRETIQKIDEEEFGFKHPLYTNFGTGPCVEFIQICGDGGVTVCPGSEEKIGNILQETIPELRKKFRTRFPKRDPRVYTGHCPFKPQIA